MVGRSVEKYKIVAQALLILFWVQSTYLFPIQELVPSAADVLTPFVNTVVDLVLILFGLWTLSGRTNIILLIALIAIALISKFVNDVSMTIFVNGMRNYLDIFFVYCILRYLIGTRERVCYFLPLMDKSLYIFLLLQMPVMVIQCIRWGAYDNVGGTLGWMMSGTISTLIYVVSFYLMVRRWDAKLPYMDNIRRNWILVVALFPTMLNETKISFVYLAMYFLLLVPMDKNFFKRLIYVLPIMVVVIAGFGYVYLNLLVNNRADEGDDDVMSVSFVTDYVVGSDEVRTLVLDGYMNTVMPDVQETDFARGLKMATLPIILSDTPHSWVVGFGPSQFRGGTVIDKTKFSQEYDWLLRGTQLTIMVYLVDLGLLGVGWLVWFLLVVFRVGKRVHGRNRRVTWFMVLTIVLSIIYLPIHILHPFLIIVLYIILLSSRWTLMRYVPRPCGLLLPLIPGPQSENSPLSPVVDDTSRAEK